MMETPESASSDQYFSSYEDVSVHKLMLQDKPRNHAYLQYIESNTHLFKDKVIVDVGAGTGILSLMVARVGARKVYAVEASDTHVLCSQIVTLNGFADKITVIHGRVEDVVLPDSVMADVIISEWMGFYLLHESMLNSLIIARDKWLSPDGIMVPSSASLYICPVSMKSYWKNTFDFWMDVCGFDFSPVLPSVQQSAFSQPVIETLEPEQCVAEPELITCLDLLYVAEEDVCKINGSYNFCLTKNTVLHGFACWFDVEFEGENTVVLDTSPSAPPTHWKQTAVLLPEPLLVNKGETINCNLGLVQDDQHQRRYNITIDIPEDADNINDEEEDGDIDDLSYTEDLKNHLLHALGDAHH